MNGKKLMVNYWHNHTLFLFLCALCAFVQHRTANPWICSTTMQLERNTLAHDCLPITHTLTLYAWG